MQLARTLAALSACGSAACGHAAAASDAAPAPIADAAPTGDPYPAPGDWPRNHGPGGPATSFAADQLFATCAALAGDASDAGEHDGAVMIDGYLLLPWAPYTGGGGVSFFDIHDPCNPVRVGVGTSAEIRETHAMGFSRAGGRFLFVNSMVTIDEGGVQTWDIADPTHPLPVGRLSVPGFYNDDGYSRVVFSMFSQTPYLYLAAADLGVFIVDAHDPTRLVVAGHLTPEPVIRIGSIFAVGNLLYLSAIGGPRALLYDISDPVDPQPIPGGVIDVVDSAGQRRESYSSTLAGGYAYLTRKDSGGGFFIYDVHDPGRPVKVTDVVTVGNGGYVLVKDDRLFQGDSFFATIYDIADRASPEAISDLNLEGDLDWNVPIGNVAILGADDGADPGRGSAIAPWRKEPDREPPRVTWVWPPDGATGQARTSRIGVTFSEMIDLGSAWEGSVRLYRTGSDPSVTRIAGWISGQEHVVNFFPEAPLAPGTSYTLEIPAGGVADLNGNAVATPFRSTFTTVGP